MSQEKEVKQMPKKIQSRDFGSMDPLEILIIQDEARKDQAKRMKNSALRKRKWEEYEKTLPEQRPT